MAKTKVDVKYVCNNVKACKHLARLADVRCMHAGPHRRTAKCKSAVGGARKCIVWGVLDNETGKEVVLECQCVVVASD